LPGVDLIKVLTLINGRAVGRVTLSRISVRTGGNNMIVNVRRLGL